MQSSTEQQGKIRKPSYVTDTKKQRKKQNGQDWRSLQENWRYQGNISYKDGHNKGQKWYGPTEVEDIEKRWQEYTEQLYKKDLHDPDNHNGVISHLETDELNFLF